MNEVKTGLEGGHTNQERVRQPRFGRDPEFPSDSDEKCRGIGTETGKINKTHTGKKGNF